jgi:hypothetical protein
MTLTLYEEMQKILSTSGAKEFISDLSNRDKYVRKIEEMRKGNVVLEECVQDKTCFVMEIHRSDESKYGRERLAMLEQCVGNIPNAYNSTLATAEYGCLGTAAGAVFGFTYGYFATRDEKEFPKITRRNFMTGFTLGGMATIGLIGTVFGFSRSKSTNDDYEGRARSLDSFIAAAYATKK